MASCAQQRILPRYTSVQTPCDLSWHQMIGVVLGGMGKWGWRTQPIRRFLLSSLPQPPHARGRPERFGRRFRARSRSPAGETGCPPGSSEATIVLAIEKSSSFRSESTKSVPSRDDFDEDFERRLRHVPFLDGVMLLCVPPEPGRPRIPGNSSHPQPSEAIFAPVVGNQFLISLRCIPQKSGISSREGEGHTTTGAAKAECSGQEGILQ